MRASLRKMGNSTGLIIPKPVLLQMGVKASDIQRCPLTKTLSYSGRQNDIHALVGQRPPSASPKRVTMLWCGRNSATLMTRI